ncbi:sensor histidine kinase [Maledivibacter halophilus]|uniref:histidine kinase n=1 Tax=Maledivibacter halophilus TaxID=36842 RepID=A0A1T5IFJ4_9FIRM|nr:sensor histidine kinase [Maledivibacter halophilus]SKC37919.1 Two-component sensor histidine kinase, contains HisKA and HATPase domains [Maledivibacter halophilus]
MIYELCKIHTYLSDRDIEKLEKIAQNLQLIADLLEADIFIDCMTKDPNAAIVVAEAKPFDYPSMYQHSVVGEFAFRKNEPAALRTLEIGMPTRDLRAITQENKSVKQSVVPIKNDFGDVIGVLIAEIDITKSIKEKKNMELLTETTEQLTKALLTFIDNQNPIHYHITDGIIIFNSNGLSTYANPVAQSLYKKLGYIDNLIGIRFNNLVLDGKTFEEIKSKRFISSSEVTIGELTLQVKYSIMKQRNIDIVGIIVVIRDISEVKAKEKELILKSVAIREIHHRVKNNLQTIASLLRLQSRRIDNETVKIAFGESISRILSIAVTHEILAQKGLDDVDIKTILSRIKNSVIDYSLLKSKNIKIEISGDKLKIDSDRATSIALVVNELLQNSLKYAFVGKEEGLIEIKIQRGSMYSNIAIIDNGVGFDMKTARPGSLGFNIVKSIVKDKLQGQINIDSSYNGTKIIFDFKNKM